MINRTSEIHYELNSKYVILRDLTKEQIAITAFVMGMYAGILILVFLMAVIEAIA